MESNRQVFLEAADGKITEEKLIELMDAETFLTPDECLEYGFIDEVNRQVQPEPEPDPDPDEDDEELNQLRAENEQMKAQIKELQQKVETLDKPVQVSMAPETVQSLVAKFFK